MDEYNDNCDMTITTLYIASSAVNTAVLQHPTALVRYWDLLARRKGARDLRPRLEISHTNRLYLPRARDGALSHLLQHLLMPPQHAASEVACARGRTMLRECCITLRMEMPTIMLRAAGQCALSAMQHSRRRLDLPLAAQPRSIRRCPHT